MDKKNRNRGENWTIEEKEIFIDIMKESAHIIDCKKTDNNTNNRKHEEWCLIQKKFQELTGKLRAVSQLRGFWRRARSLPKNHVFQQRRVLFAIGSGERSPSPSQEEQHVINICPSDFITEITEDNKFDGDGHFYKEEPSTTPSQVKIISNKDNTSTPNKPEQTVATPKNHIKTEKRLQAAVEETNIEIKKRMLKLLEEEYALKLQYQKQELLHQEIRHKLELEILAIEKEKKEWELNLLKSKKK